MENRVLLTLPPPSTPFLDLLSGTVCFFSPSLLPLPPFLLSPSVSCAFSTLFSLTQTLQCATLELQQSVIVQHAQAAKSRVVISSHCPCAVTCTKEHGGEREKKDERKREVDVGERWRRNEIRVWGRDGNILMGMEGCFVFLHWGQLGNTNRCKDVFFRANRDGQTLSTNILVWICIYLIYL